MGEKKLGKYIHYKGNLYEIIAFGKHSENLEDMVIYKALYESEEFGKDMIWIRPEKNFFEMVEINGIKKARFTFLE
ncbi:DUF1653 domain-containing protein [bacterium]|nr:DUF1653 domain-containing protein [bacterium]